MDTSKLKRFAPECREQLIEQVGVKLDYVLTTRTPDLAEQENLVKALQKAIDSEGRERVIERVAYTWFNRLAALRYLDARGWHPFRLRVVTPASEDETQPELLRQVRQGVIPDELKDFVPANRVNDLLDGKLPSPNPQAEVQRLLVIGVCQYYAFLLPDLFERLDDFSQLLLPDDLLTEHSAVNGFRTEISDEDCSEVEILGWLYQFYISEKKDTVMARKKAVPSEDIPAVTQLFTPHWIVRYLVENSLGRLWLRSRPHSRLREHMPYYVEDPEGQEPTDSLTVDRPEEIKLLDPACGSGHMLTYAFDLLVKIYEEEGHAPSEIPEKILTHNLFGLEICPRAAQLAQFALVCKAREQSRTAFRRPVQPQILCLRDVVLTPDEVKGFTEATGVKFSQDEVAQIHQFRENTETFGSLIQPVLDGNQITALKAKIGEQATAGDLLVQNTHRKLRLVLDQAEMLSQRYQVVVANPPYMDKFDGRFRTFAADRFPLSKANTYSMFIERCGQFTHESGIFGLITLQGWMFLSSYDGFRAGLLESNTLISMMHLGTRAFDSIGGEVVASTAFVLCNTQDSDATSSYFNLTSGGSEAEKIELYQRILDRRQPSLHYVRKTNELHKIAGWPLAYWASEKVIDSFNSLPRLDASADPRSGMATGDNHRFLRVWSEVSLLRVSFDSPTREEAKRSLKHWFPYNKGGAFRKWYGNNTTLVLFHDDGFLIKETKRENLAAGLITANNSKCWNQECYFLPSLTWSALSTSISVRKCGSGFIFDTKGQCLFPEDESDLAIYNALLNSHLSSLFLEILTPTLDFNSGYLRRIPDCRNVLTSRREIESVEECCVDLARADWDNFETSWDFRDLPLLRPGDWEVEPDQAGGAWKGRTLAESWANYASYCAAAIRRMQELETENNRLWIDAYGLQDELDPAVPEDEITLARADARKDMAAFLSYAVGCMMGRYSLDHPGLILADAGDTFEQYFEKVGKSGDEVTFLPDDDAIIPITEDDWFEDDAASRVREFLKATFGSATVDENVAFIEEALGKDLRKYFTANTGGFYADHVKTYKKRPIYWLFQSPKKHFRALVYLHRYTKDTVNTLLNGYLREFHHKLTAKIGDLEHVIGSASASQRDKTRAQKALDKAQAALRDVEEYERDILLPLAQQRIEIDLDDGVKANYPKFGKALAKVSGLS